MALYLNEKTTLWDGGLDILHFAPNEGLASLIREHAREYVSADLLDETVDIQADITDLPLDSERFDVVICSNVLEHVPDDESAIAELYRVMRTGGWGVFQVPFDHERAETFEDPSVTDPDERERLFGQHDHVRLYGRDYPNRLAAAGFDVTVDAYPKQMAEIRRRRFGLQADERVFYCSKR